MMQKATRGGVVLEAWVGLFVDAWDAGLVVAVASCIVVVLHRKCPLPSQNLSTESPSRPASQNLRDGSTVDQLLAWMLCGCRAEVCERALGRQSHEKWVIVGEFRACNPQCRRAHHRA